jgi:hypothetical protein
MPPPGGDPTGSPSTAHPPAKTRLEPKWGPYFALSQIWIYKYMIFFAIYIYIYLKKNAQGIPMEHSPTPKNIYYIYYTLHIL